MSFGNSGTPTPRLLPASRPAPVGHRHARLFLVRFFYNNAGRAHMHSFSCGALLHATRCSLLARHRGVCRLLDGRQPLHQRRLLRAVWLVPHVALHALQQAEEVTARGGREGGDQQPWSSRRPPASCTPGKRASRHRRSPVVHRQGVDGVRPKQQLWQGGCGAGQAVSAARSAAHRGAASHGRGRCSQPSRLAHTRCRASAVSAASSRFSSWISGRSVACSAQVAAGGVEVPGFRRAQSLMLLPQLLPAAAAPHLLGLQRCAQRRLNVLRHRGVALLLRLLRASRAERGQCRVSIVGEQGGAGGRGGTRDRQLGTASTTHHAQVGVGRPEELLAQRVHVLPRHLPPGRKARSGYGEVGGA